MQEERLVSFRLNLSEYDGLKRLAAKDVRTITCWLRFKVIEALRAEFTSTEETNPNRTDLSMENKENREGSPHGKQQ